MLVDCDYDYGLPAAQVAQENGMVAMNLCAGAPAAGDPSLLPLGFSMGVATNLEAATMADYAFNELGFTKGFLLRDTSITYSKSVCDYFAEAFEMAGGEIVGTEEFNNSDTSIQSQVSALTSAEGEYDFINICSYAPGLSTAIRQIRSAGIDTPVVGSVTWDGDYWLGDGGAGDLSDAYFPAYGSIWGDDPRPEVNEVVAAVKEQMGDIPFTSFLLPGYSSIEALAMAIEQAGTTEGQALTAALEGFTNVELLVGPVTYTAEQHTRMLGSPTLAIMKIDGGVPSFVELYPAPAEIPEP
jgi:branched-chain amino acid transport system substrate-binding protein